MLESNIEWDIYKGKPRKFTYQPGMVYISWCNFPKVKIGTLLPPQSLLDDVIRPSNISKMDNDIPELAQESTTRSVSLTFMVGMPGIASITPGVGGSKGKQFRMANHIRQVPNEFFSSFEETLESAKKTLCILWDNSAKRAWLLPGVTALLFTTLCRIKDLKWTVQGMEYPVASAEASEPAEACLRKNEKSTITKQSGDTLTELFGIFVQRVWSGMTDADKISRTHGGEGKKHPIPNKVFGYDLADLFGCRFIRLRYLDTDSVGNNLKSWMRLAQVDDIMVIFCGRTGRVIDCDWNEHVEADDNGEEAGSCSCSASCCDQSDDRGVLSCLLQDLRKLSSTDWEKEASNILTIRPGITWTARGTRPYLFGHTPLHPGAPCACCKKLERLQSVGDTGRSGQRPGRMARLWTWLARRPGANVDNPGRPDWLGRPYAVRFGSCRSPRGEIRNTVCIKASDSR